MRVVIGEKRIVLTGKAWEIQALLKKYSKEHKLLKDWLDSCTLIE
ncbi:Z-ring formation inhibitor MciZ [Siminovitchia sp. 179-K 8D1 HS]